MLTEVVINWLQLIFSLILAIYFMQLIKSFGYMNLAELKRRAEAGQVKAQRVLRSRLYGLKLWLLLWSFLCLMIILSISAIDGLVGSRWLALVLDVILLIGLLFALPWAKWPKPDLDLASTSSVALIWMLNKLSILLKPFTALKLGQKFHLDTPFYIHSKDNLLDIIKELKGKTKNPAIINDLNLAVSSLVFSNKKIRNYSLPLTASKMVGLGDRLTPHFIDKLYDLGFSTFPVRHPKSKDICGVLYFRDIKSLRQHTLLVKDVMRTDLCYVSGEAGLEMVLDAFLKTGQHLFLVIGKNSKIKGFITVSKVLQEYLGKQKPLDFMEYDNQAAVEQMMQENGESKNAIKTTH